MLTNLYGVWALCNLHEAAVVAALQANQFKPYMAGHPDIPASVQAASGFTPESYWADRLSIGQKGDVVVIPVVGAMTRGSSWGNYFSNTFIMGMLASIAENDSKKGVILEFDTGGGTVDSLDEFAAQVQATMRQKPVVASTNFCASAGYYIASQCSEVIMRPSVVAQIGSIGTIMVYADYSKMLEKEGINIQIFRSTGSVDKAKMNGVEPLDDTTKADVQKMLDACNKQFKGAVRTGRGAKLTSDEIFTGKLYGAADAKRLGMIDRTGDLTVAYNRVISLSK